MRPQISNVIAGLRGTPPVIAIYFAFWFFYFIFFWTQAAYTSPSGNMMVSNDNLWADWALHFTLTTTMAIRDMLPDTSPLLLDAPFHYSFASNWISALLMKAGMPVTLSHTMPSLLFSLLLVVALFYFFKLLFGSNRIAALASTIFLVSGGTGFTFFIKDIFSAPDALTALAIPPREYTNLDQEGIVVQSLLNSMLIPQRSFVHGLPIGLFALSLIYTTVIHRSAATDRMPYSRLLAISVLVGILPIFHIHSFMAMFVILCCWSVGYVLFSPVGTLVQRLKPWLIILAGTCVVAIPLLALFIYDESTSGFISWLPGWIAGERSINWLWFWFENWSLLPVLAIAGAVMLLRTGKTLRQRLEVGYLFLPFFGIFVLINLLKFQPWSWDNTKILAWATLGFSGLAAYAIALMWRFGRDVSSYPPDERCRPRSMLVVAVFSIFMCTASGSVDAYRIVRMDIHNYTMFTREELELAEWAKNNTPLDSIWLTSDNHHHWLTNLTGRQSLMAYRGWVSSHGYNYQEQERDMSSMFQTGDRTLLQKYRINFVVIGPTERDSWHANQTAFEQQYPVILRRGAYAIFKVS